jgi:hypothetical protein
MICSFLIVAKPYFGQIVREFGRTQLRKLVLHLYDDLVVILQNSFSGPACRTSNAALGRQWKITDLSRHRPTPKNFLRKRTMSKVPARREAPWSSAQINRRDRDPLVPEFAADLLPGFSITLA